jgi:hypothetical protein
MLTSQNKVRGIDCTDTKVDFREDYHQAHSRSFHNDRGLTYQEDQANLDIYVHNNRASKCIKQK